MSNSHSSGTLRRICYLIVMALVVGGVAVLIGVLPTALGLPSWVAFLMGFVVLCLIVRLVGKKVET